MSVRKRGLGRGLDALLSSVGPLGPEPGEELRELPLESLQPGRHQPRRAFDKEALESLAESIREQGVVQPIVVRPAGANKYEIVAGERRWRAAVQVGLTTIPAVVRALDERGAMAVALVENIQRSDLNPLEEAEALHKLIEDCGLTHDQCAKAIGRKRATVTNLLRLMELNADVQELVRANRLSLGHAKVLLGVAGPRQTSLAKLVVDKEFSVRQLEQLVHVQTKPAERAAKPARGKLELEISERIGLPVRITHNPAGRGRLVIGFKHKAEFDKLLKIFR